MEEKIKKIIASELNLPIEKVTADALLIEDLGADSLDLVEMLTTFEDEFGIMISDEQAKDVRTVKDFCELVNKVQEKK